MIESDILRQLSRMHPVGDTSDPLLHGVTAQLCKALSASNALVALYDYDDRLRYANDAFCTAYAVAPHTSPTWEAIMRRNYADRVGAALDTNDIDAWIVEAMARRCKTRSRQFESDMQDGRWFLVNETTGDDGWTMLVATDVTTLHASERSLRRARDVALKSSQTDAMTGVANRRRIMDQLNTTIHCAASTPACACLLDIDHFKDVNDRLGHAAGDAVLVAFTRTVQRTIRARDCLGRIGGEEFILILSGADIDIAAKRVQNVLDAVRQMVVARMPPGFRVSCSAGLTQIIPNDGAADVFHRFDTALYQAKRAGRNRLVVKAAV